MPGPFDITAATNTIRLNAQRRGEASFTVFNNSGRALRGRATLVALTPVAAPWLTLEGANERDFAVAATEQFTVHIAAPPEAAPGTYTFRLDEVDVALPDEGLTTGPSVNFDVPVPPPPPVKPKFPIWIPIAIGAVLLLVIIGVIAFLLLRPTGPRFDGQWVTNFGTMSLQRNGNNLQGNFHNAFDNSNGTLTGSVSGNVFNGSWLGNGSGALQMTLAADGKTLDGRRNTTDRWCGARAGEAFPPGCSYAGAWNTSTGIPFPVVMTRTDTTVTGMLTATLGTTIITGTITGNVAYNGTSPGTILNATYTVGPGGTGGTGTVQYFLLGFIALQFQGNVSGGAWCGAREGQPLPVPCLASIPAGGQRELPGAPFPLLSLTPVP
jgi:hypothetical protein